jgi:hypothetical protein
MVTGMRELRTEMMRSTAPAAALAALFVYGLTLINRDTWSTGWPDLSTSLRSFLILLIPVAAAAGAWQGGRERRAQTEELMATVPRPPWQRTLTPIAAVTVAVVATLALALALTGAWTGPGAWRQQIWPVATSAVGLLALAAAIAVGAGLGRMARSNLTAPLVLCLSAIGLVVLYGRGSGTWLSMYNPSMKPPQDIGGLRAEFQQVRPVISTGQAIWLAGLLLTGSLLVAATTARARLTAAIPAAVGALLAVPFFVAPGAYNGGVFGSPVAYGPDTKALTLYCAPGAPPVCGAAAHEQRVLQAAIPAREVLAALQRLPGAPTRAVEESQYLDKPVPADVLPLSTALVAAGLNDRLRTSAASGLGIHADCTATDSKTAQDTAEADALAGAWLLDSSSTEAFGDYESLDQKLRSFEKLPSGEQVRRMAALRQALRDCRPGAMAIITGAAR